MVNTQVKAQTFCLGFLFPRPVSHHAAPVDVPTERNALVGGDTNQGLD